MKKHTWKIVFAVAAILILGSIGYAQYAANKANEGVVLTDHVIGNPDAKVSLTEYGDFQCPACGAFHPIVKGVLEQYGDQIRFEFKNLPLTAIHPYAMPAAKAAEAAGVQGKYFEMHDKLFEDQKAWSSSPTPQVFFTQYAEELGLDVELFKKHMKASVINEKITEHTKEAQGLGFTGTPSFLLNGEPLEFETYEEFIGAIEAALGVTPQATTSTSSVESSVEFGLPQNI